MDENGEPSCCFPHVTELGLDIDLSTGKPSSKLHEKNTKLSASFAHKVCQSKVHDHQRYQHHREKYQDHERQNTCTRRNHHNTDEEMIPKEDLMNARPEIINHEIDTPPQPSEEIILLNWKRAPAHLAFNKHIRNGYRSSLTFKQCIHSIFWYTNETVNIWSHLFGCVLFMGMLIYDMFLLNFHATLTDKLVVGGLLVCFQVCMMTSVMYHTFNCRSEEHYRCLLKYDIYGISFSLLAIYMTGIYYAFWCHGNWCSFYTITIGTIFLAVMTLQLLSKNETLKLCVFVLWAAYGVVPTIHWAVTMGGWDNPIVERLLPRVMNMYLISGLAFFFYISYIPERFFPGSFDFIGSSHQLWHCLVVYALYYWHNTGIQYIEYRMNHSCFPTY